MLQSARKALSDNKRDFSRGLYLEEVGLSKGEDKKRVFVSYDGALTFEAFSVIRFFMFRLYANPWPSWLNHEK